MESAAFITVQFAAQISVTAISAAWAPRPLPLIVATPAPPGFQRPAARNDSIAAATAPGWSCCSMCPASATTCSRPFAMCARRRRTPANGSVPPSLACAPSSHRGMVESAPASHSTPAFRSRARSRTLPQTIDGRERQLVARIRHEPRRAVRRLLGPVPREKERPLLGQPPVALAQPRGDVPDAGVGRELRRLRLCVEPGAELRGGERRVLGWDAEAVERHHGAHTLGRTPA